MLNKKEAIQNISTALSFTEDENFKPVQVKFCSIPTRSTKRCSATSQRMTREKNQISCKILCEI